MQTKTHTHLYVNGIHLGMAKYVQFFPKIRIRRTKYKEKTLFLLSFSKNDPRVTKTKYDLLQFILKHFFFTAFKLFKYITI